MSSVLYALLPVFFLIFTGTFLKKWFIRSESFWRFAEELTYDLLAPALFALVANKADFSAPEISNALTATIVATIAVIAIIFLTRLVFKVENSFFISIFQGGIRSNSYLFLAIAHSLYGEAGSVIASVFVACTLVISNIAFIMFTSQREKSRKKKIVSIAKALFYNPLIFGCFVGLALNIIGIHVTKLEIAKNYLDYLASIATPLNLLSIGAGLNLAIQWEKLIITIYASSLKLIIMPICTIVMLQLFDVTGVVASIAVLYSAIPCAGNAYIVSQKLGGDSESMASITTWTTLVSLLTMSFLLSVASWMH